MIGSMTQGPALYGLESDPDLKARVFAEHPLPWVLEDDHIWDANGWAVKGVEVDRLSDDGEGAGGAGLARDLWLLPPGDDDDRHRAVVLAEVRQRLQA